MCKATRWRGANLQGNGGRHTPSSSLFLLTIFLTLSYFAEWDLPRPESYTKDVALAKQVTWRLPQDVYRDLSTAAETGWDFSTRWFVTSNMTTIRAMEIAPADLNAFLLVVENTLARFSRICEW